MHILIDVLLIAVILTSALYLKSLSLNKLRAESKIRNCPQCNTLSLKLLMQRHSKHIFVIRTRTPRICPGQVHANTRIWIHPLVIAVLVAKI